MIKPTTIKVVIADDNKFFVDALSDSLASYEELSVIGKFTTIKDTINFTQNNTFDILILDVNFNGKSSLDYIEEIRGNNISFKIISLTTMNNSYIKSEAKEKGIHSFVGKDSDLSNFKNIIVDCFNNNTVIEAQNNNNKITIDNLSFTKRKLEILQTLYSYSHKNGKEISEILNITENALKSHKRELFEITNTTNTTELIKFGIQKGLIVA